LHSANRCPETWRTCAVPVFDAGQVLQMPFSDLQFNVLLHIVYVKSAFKRGRKDSKEARSYSIAMSVCGSLGTFLVHQEVREGQLEAEGKSHHSQLAPITYRSHRRATVITRKFGFKLCAICAPIDCRCGSRLMPLATPSRQVAAHHGERHNRVYEQHTTRVRVVLAQKNPTK
jgi:hypothetical protein